ncbi:hypothetical protein SCHPADRAFT_390867 [Schizopora paradoxa]|uniref:Zn(2)-C6 fungal-type domain-containing protein n=1 Tax=Schizopora paradoxa TaxID=27342 RepID=A0A0H2RMX9_9AGAM|nr:hypothetical protein SCHPADRAFT_390867 [Schizopora paradoxa]
MVTPLILIPSMASSYPPSEHHPIYHYSTIGSRTTALPLDVQLPTLSGILIPPLSGFAHLLPKTLPLAKKQLAKPQLDRIDTKCAEIESPLSQRIVPYTNSPPPTSTAATLTDSVMSAMGLLTPSTFSEFHTRDDKSMPSSAFDISHASRRGGDSILDSPGSPRSQRVIPSASTGEDDETDAEDAWNLVPYNIAWGPSYYGYKKGTLPGPDGKSIFLRSPTPLKNQRTGQACEKCRERKAKCSGSRPSCARCLARGHTCEYGPEIKKAKHSDSEDSSAGEEDDDDDDSDQQEDVDVLASTSKTSVAKALLAKRPTTSVRKRRNTESGALPSLPPSRRLGVRRHSILNPSRGVTAPTNKKRRVTSYSSQQKLSPASDDQFLQTPDGGSCMSSPFSDSSDAGSFFSLPSYPNSAMSSPLTPQGASQDSYLTVPSFSMSPGAGMVSPMNQDLLCLDTQSLQIVDASHLSTFDTRTADATFYVPQTTFNEGIKTSEAPSASGSLVYHSNFINGMSQISLDMPSLDNNFSGDILGLENTFPSNFDGNYIPRLQVTDFDSSTQSMWPSSAAEPSAPFDELAFLAQLAQLPATIFDFKQEQ